MEFDIRYQISELEEEIYSFLVYNNSIVYNGFWFSERMSPNEPFGYDWETYYDKQKQLELDALEKEFGEEIYNWDHYEHEQVNKINDKYNPVVNGVLSGVFSSDVPKDHPLKISEEFIKTALIEKIKGMKVR